VTKIHRGTKTQFRKKQICKNKIKRWKNSLSLGKTTNKYNDQNKSEKMLKNSFTKKVEILRRKSRQITKHKSNMIHNGLSLKFGNITKFQVKHSPFTLYINP